MCNNFLSFSFATPAATGVCLFSRPKLDFRRTRMWGQCSTNEGIAFYFRDSATNNLYNLSDMYSNKVFWGDLDKPTCIRIENATNPAIVYADRNMSLTMNGTTPYLGVDYNINGATGLNAPGTG